MTWSFARDGGLPASRIISKVVRGLDVPLVALMVGAFIPIVYGVIFIGSSSALNAILSSSVVLCVFPFLKIHGLTRS
jgi:choline transport protein